MGVPASGLERLHELYESFPACQTACLTAAIAFLILLLLLLLLLLSLGRTLLGHAYFLYSHLENAMLICEDGRSTA